jgi:DNA-binding SARP family transcriptional activator
MPGSRQNGVRTPQSPQAASPGPSATVATHAVLATAGRLVEGRRYDEAAEVMRELQPGDRADSHGAAGEALMAARQISLSCHEYRLEAQVHREAARGAASREQRLRERLLTILRLAGARPATATAAHRAQPSGPAPGNGRTASARAAVLAVHCLGPLRVYKDGMGLEPWPNRRSKSLFKYFVCHRDRVAPKELLMDLFWPEATARAARNNLNVAVHHLRRMLRNGGDELSYVVFEDDAYRLNPELDVWVDAEEFEHLIGSARRMSREGDRASAIRDYEAAEALYLGDLFEEDPYEDWTLPRRRALQDAYLGALQEMGNAYLGDDDHEASAALYRKVLAVDPCREEAHRGLMRCYAHGGQRHLALRQYQQCVATLSTTLGLAPAPETAALRERIRRDPGVRAVSAN